MPLADSRKAGRPINPLRIVMSHERGHRAPFPPAVMIVSTLFERCIKPYICTLICPMVYGRGKKLIDWF